MKLTDMFKGIPKDIEKNIIDVITGGTGKAKFIETIAIAHAIDLIAKTVSKAELIVNKYNKETKQVEEEQGNIYYRLNLRPNHNELAKEFWYKLVIKLMKESEVLVVPKKENKIKIPYLYIADDWEVLMKVLSPNEYSNIKIKLEEKDKEVETILKDKIFADDLIHLNLNNKEISTSMDEFNKNFNKILKTSLANYNAANVNKWRLKHPGGQLSLIDPNTNKPMEYDAYKKKLTEGLVGDEESIILLSEMFDLILLNKDLKVNSEDYRNLIKENCDKVAMIFNIPLDIFYGNKTEKSKSDNEFINNAIVPIYSLIENGLNVVLIGENDYIKGERILYDKFNNKVYDIMDIAGPLEKLVGIGFSHNDIRVMLKMKKINEPWADEHNITKNFGNVKGGEKEDE